MRLAPSEATISTSIGGPIPGPTTETDPVPILIGALALIAATFLALKTGGK